MEPDNQGEYSIAAYEAEREQAWAGFAKEARESDTFRTACSYLGRRRGAQVAVLESYLRSTPEGERVRLEDDAEYFLNRVEGLVSALAPLREFRRLLARQMAMFLRTIRGTGRTRDPEGYVLARTAVRMSTRVEDALQAHDTYREFRCRVLPQTRTAHGH